jgi:predicted permease
MRSGAAFDHLWQDVRYALRLMRRSPGFSAVAIFTLACAVAANSAVFSVIEGVILRPLTYADSGRLVAISQVTARRDAPVMSLPVAAVHFEEWRKSAGSFAGLSLLEAERFELTGPGEPEIVPGGRISANLFALLGVAMARGRAFVEDEESPGVDRVVILGDELWRRRFGSDPDIIGQMISVGGIPHRVVGLLPPRFRFPVITELYPVPILAERDRPQMWKPLSLAAFEHDARLPVFNYGAIGRLKPGVPVSHAASELNVLQRQLASFAEGGSEFHAVLQPLQDRIVSGYRAGLMLIWASVGAALLVGCVNLANLLLARGARRRREMAVRSALGASRGRIARQMLVESLVLSIISGALGLVGASATLRLIVAFAPGDVPRLDEVHLDVRVVVFTLAVVLLDSVLFGVLPAWRSSRIEPQDAMRSDSPTSSAGREWMRLRGLLVSVEVGICTLGLIIGALLLQSFTRAINVRRGFDVDRLVTVDVALPNTRYSGGRRAAFLRSTVERLEALPGVASVGVTSLLPLSGGDGPGMPVIAAGSAPMPALERPTGRIRLVNAAYFATLGIPLKAGRLFRDSDRGRPVAVLSGSAADRLWPSERPLGRRIHLIDEDSPPFEVVGVVGDARSASLTTDPSHTIYLPYWQPDMNFISRFSLAMKTNDADGTARLARAALRDEDPELPIPAFRTMDEIMKGSLGQRRLQTGIVLLFAGAGLLLAGAGIYGVVSYSVAQRTHEIGIRMALGAGGGAIRRLVVAQGLAPLVPGVAAGVGAALGLERVVAALLFEITPRDPATIAAVIAGVTVVALAASYLPARRATRIDPVSALRGD